MILSEINRHREQRLGHRNVERRQLLVGLPLWPCALLSLDPYGWNASLLLVGKRATELFLRGLLVEVGGHRARSLTDAARTIEPSGASTLCLIAKTASAATGRA